MISGNKYLVALVKGDPKPILELYQQCFPKVRKFVLQNKGNEEDAQDTFHKALLQIAVRYRKEVFEVRGDFLQYLFTVCRNLWRRELNKSKDRVTNDNFGNIHSDEQDAAMALMEQKRYELFQEKLNQLSENCKKILSMYFAKASYAEIVKVGEYNSETVARQRVFKCKKKLTDIIRKDNRYRSLKEL